MQELDHSMARANDLQKAQAEQLSEITRISKEIDMKALSLTADLLQERLSSYVQLPIRLVRFSPGRIKW